MWAGLDLVGPSFEHDIDLGGDVREAALADLVFYKRKTEPASTGPDEFILPEYVRGHRGLSLCPGLPGKRASARESLPLVNGHGAIGQHRGQGPAGRNAA